MVLSDVDIRRYIAQGKIRISPELPPEQFGSCSVDFKLGNEFNVFEHSRNAYIDLRENKGIEGLMKSVMVPAGESFILQPREFLRRALCEARSLLFARRLRCQFAADGRASGEFGVRADQGQLLLEAGGTDRRAHRRVQLQDGCEGACGRHPPGNPGRVFEHARECADELQRRQRVELLEADHDRVTRDK